MRTYEFKTLSGKEIKLEITYSAAIKDVKHDYDGHIDTQKELVVNQEIKAYVNEKLTGSTMDLTLCTIKDSAYEGRVPAQITNFLMISGAPIALTAEQANDINAIITELKATETTLEAAEKEEEIATIEIAEEIEEAKEILRIAGNQKTIFTKVEANRIRENYNIIHNEGKEGYVPHIVDVDEYNWALKTLNK